MQATPIIICWNLWKNRCAKKYGDKRSNTSRVIYSISKDITHLLITAFPQIKWPLRWTDLMSMVEHCKHEIKVTKVCWTKPSAPWVKLNTDGSALENPGNIGAGGVLRDHRGNFIYAFAIPLGIGTNNQAEVRAAICGLTWCIQNGYNRIILEVDSELLTKWLLHNINPPWSVQEDIAALQNLSNILESFCCRHVYREANYVANILSKHSHILDNIHQFLDHHHLPEEARGYFRMDKLGMPHFRRRKLNRIKKPP